jgi:hypothetical protein
VTGDSAIDGGGIANQGKLTVSSRQIITNQPASHGGGIATTSDCFDAHVSMRNQTAAEADESDWGLVVRVEILRVWLPPVLSELAKQDPPTAVIRTHEELRRHLELCGQENMWYAMIWRGHNAHREFVDIPVVRQPYGEARLFPELLELLSSAAGNSHGEPTGLYATTSFGLLPESFLKREPRAAVADLLDDPPPPLNAERIR